MLKQGPDFHFEISEFEITRVDCIYKVLTFTKSLVFVQHVGANNFGICHCPGSTLWKLIDCSNAVLHGLLNVITIKYSRLSLSRIPRDSLKYFEISVPRHIRFAELRKNNSNLTNMYVIRFLRLEIYWKYCGKEEKLQFLLSSTILFFTCC